MNKDVAFSVFVTTLVASAATMAACLVIAREQMQGAQLGATCTSRDRSMTRQKGKK